MTDSINPAHYKKDDPTYETIKVIEAWGLGFCLGNVLKYISRAGEKGDRIEDLKKARWYLDREISRGETEKPHGVWIEHTGDKCPVDGNTMVRVRLRNGAESSGGVSYNWRWAQDNSTADITHYMIAPE